MSDEPKVYQSGFAQVAHLSLEEERAAWRSRLDAANARIAELEEVLAAKDARIVKLGQQLTVAVTEAHSLAQRLAPSVRNPLDVERIAELEAELASIDAQVRCHAKGEDDTGCGCSMMGTKLLVVDLKASHGRLERERDEARAETARTLTYWRGAWHGAHEEGLEFRARAEAAEAEVARLRQALAYVEENVLCSGCLEQDAYEQVRDFMEGTRDAFYDPVLEREARLREALEFYASEESWADGPVVMVGKTPRTQEGPALADFGDRARRALQQQPQAQEGDDAAR